VKEIASDLIEKSIEKSADRDNLQKINFNIGRYNAVVPGGKQQFENLNLAREKAKNIKWRAIESLDKQLERFEAGISKRGAKVIWAETAEEATEEILRFAEKRIAAILSKVW
jgi:L-lactate dehydrogenase complex protein LldF